MGKSLLSNVAGYTKFRINDTKLYVPVVTLSAKDNVNFTKQQNKGFKQSVYWNKYKSKYDNYNQNQLIPKRINLDLSFQGVNRLFVLAFYRAAANPVTVDGHQHYFLPRVKFNDYNVVIDGHNFYDNPISSEIEQYDELRKVILGKGDDYTTGCLLDFDYFKKHYRLVAIDLSKQKEFDVDPRAVEQIEFIRKLQQNATVYTTWKNQKKLFLNFTTELSKSCKQHING